MTGSYVRSHLLLIEEELKENTLLTSKGTPYGVEQMWLSVEASTMYRVVQKNQHKL